MDIKASSHAFFDELLEAIQALQSWVDFRDSIVREAGKVMKSFTSRDDAINRAILLSIVGENIRCIWNAGDEFRPELLREPYVGSNELCLIQSQLIDEFRKVLKETSFKEMPDQLKSLRRDIQRVLDETLASQIYSKMRALPDNVSECSTESGFEITNHNTVGGRDTTALSLLGNQLSMVLFSSLEKLRDMPIEATLESAGNLLMSNPTQDSKIQQSTDNISTRPIPSSALGFFGHSVSDATTTKRTGSRRVSSFSGVVLSQFAINMSKQNIHVDGIRDRALVSPGNPNTSLAGIIEGYGNGIEDALEFPDKDIEVVCSHLRGCLLPDHARRIMWHYKFMLCDPTELISDSTHNMDDFRRLAPQRGLDITHLQSSPIYDLVVRSVYDCILLSLTHSVRNRMGIPSSKSLDRISMHTIDSLLNDTTLKMLPKKCILLVAATYVLSGTVSNRSVCISLLLLRVFQDDPPICEKMLALWKRLTTTCLPSLILHKPFSVLSVAQTVFVQLKRVEPVLFNFLQYEAQFVMQGESLSVSSMKDVDMKALPMARSYLFLREILENGFVGWLPEYAALFVWDALAMHGGTPSTFRAVLPSICVSIIVVVKSKLLGCESDIVAAFREACKTTRTQLIVDAVNQALQRIPLTT